MGKKTLPQAVHTAACGAQPQAAPWTRRGRRGVSITIIVIELLRWKSGTLDWSDPLDTAMAVAIVLSSLEMICNTARLFGRYLARLLPKRVVFERPDGKARFAFGW
ncbi:hypothetical protein [Streptomyces avidinii]|uniref:Uncharacterized protein n=1 Tax=Streptomyces avidinii TaxID=1895 RepID=A0ABS4LHF4_STRAV|nr:hypothetical protein [Streptomyces avidinii]MBP2041561.1 hypothetical protein [Streptomyces avidinii]GGZ34142.1 hypothetical protein GCM10010343_71900 [Streptomyces avidinii]